MSSAEDSEGEEKVPTLQEIMEMKKSEMEEWLADRNMPKSAKTKEVLAKRILRNCLAYDDVSSDDEENGNDVCPHIIPACPGKLFFLY
jgi:hypothetical protein